MSMPPYHGFSGLLMAVADLGPQAVAAYLLFTLPERLSYINLPKHRWLTAVIADSVSTAITAALRLRVLVRGEGGRLKPKNIGGVPVALPGNLDLDLVTLRSSCDKAS
jgi:hypothetical protein